MTTRDGDGGVVGKGEVEVRQHVGLADVDHVRQLHVSFLHMDDVQVSVEAMSEV